MGTYEELKAAIQQVITTNGNNEITGALLRQTLLSIVNTVGSNATFAGIATPTTNPGTPDPYIYYIATEAGEYVNMGNIIVNRGEFAIIRNRNNAWSKTLISALSLETDVAKQIFERGNISYGEEVDNDLVCRSNFIPCKQNDIINGYIYRVKVYDNSLNYLGEEGQSYNGITIVNHTIVNESCAYVRIIIYKEMWGKGILSVNETPALYLTNKEIGNLLKSSLLTEKREAFILSNLFSSVYEITDDVINIPILFAIKDLAIEAENGYLYTLVLRNLETSSQFSVYRATAENPRTLQYCGNFDTTIGSQRSGLSKYSVTLETGEKAKAIVDWDEAKGLETGALYPDLYHLKTEVYNGGLLSNRLIPEIDLLSERITELEAIADAGEGLPKEIYWAVCGDSITNANHASIEDIEDSDPYCPFDGYTEVSTYKRKNYAYYIAQKARLKWANYGYGGTTLSSITSKAYGYKNAFVDERMRNLANKDWDYISIFFGGNDSYFGPTAQRDKWLQETYGEDIGYPITAEQIGTPGFATLEQKNACDSVTGEVAGVEYTDNNEYFLAKFIGSIDSMETDTWYGALNTCVQYLLANHAHAKIILIASYTPGSPKYADAVIEVAEKWGVRYFDFREIPFWATASNANYESLINPNRDDGKWEMENGNLQNSTIYGRNTALYLYDGAHPTNRGYYTMGYLLKEAILS